MRTVCNRLAVIFRRELHIFAHRPLYLFTLIVAPMLCAVFFTTLMSAGLPTKLPAGLVDEDDTHVTHTLTRILDSMEETDLVARYPSFSEARHAMQRGEIYGFLYIPTGLTEAVIANRQPRLSFYTNDCYFVASSLLMKDLRYACELLGVALTRETLSGKGFTSQQSLGILQPVGTEMHPLNNPYLNYSVYLNNTILPGILLLLVMLSTTYTIGLEWKRGTQRELYALGGCSSTVALVGKLLPQTVLFSLLMVGYDVYLYKILLFPCLSGIGSMMLLGVVSVLAAQAFGVFFFGVFIGQMRLCMSLCTLWGVLSISLSGFTFPVPTMGPVLQVVTRLFPLRHYFLIYTNLALNGYSVLYAWTSVVALLGFLLMPCTVLWRYRMAFLKYEYKQ